MANKRMTPARMRYGKLLVFAGLVSFALVFVFRMGIFVNIGLGAFLAAFWLARNVVVCPQCGKKLQSIGGQSENCRACGTPYFEEGKAVVDAVPDV